MNRLKYFFSKNSSWLTFYVLPLVINIVLFRLKIPPQPLTGHELVAVGVLTIVPVINWILPVLWVLKIIGGLVTL